MANRSISPLRRHVLSSMNPDQGGDRRDRKAKRRRRGSSEVGDDEFGPQLANTFYSDPPLASTTPATSKITPMVAAESASSQAPELAPTAATDATTTTTTASATKLRFKSKSSRAARSPSPHSTHHRQRTRDPYAHEGDQEHGHDDPSSLASRHRRHHRRHRRQHKKTHRRSRSPTPPNPYEPPALDPETAFREALFDAMADDEGAAYWEGVYGQPMHVYDGTKTGPAGELERMTDEEYAAYVRQKMWEKTHEGLLEERARRQAEKERKEQEQRKAAEEAKKDRKLREEMEQSIKRGEERREKKMWERRWREYTNAWSGWDGGVDTIPWPTESGNRDEVGEDGQAVRQFFIKGLLLADLNEQIGGDKKAVAARLRDERVRWHPDKVQQRLGGSVDEAVMKAVTAIFQVLDKLWNDTRPKP